MTVKPIAVFPTLADARDQLACAVEIVRFDNFRLLDDVRAQRPNSATFEIIVDDWRYIVFEG